MKNSLLVIAAVLLFAACQKKSPHTYCYQCAPNDSIVSNVPALNNPHAGTGTDFHCGLTDGAKNLLVKQNTYIDTFYKHDTMIINHYTYPCDLSE